MRIPTVSGNAFNSQWPLAGSERQKQKDLSGRTFVAPAFGSSPCGRPYQLSSDGTSMLLSGPDFLMKKEA